MTPLVFGVFISVFLLALKPFGLNELSAGRLAASVTGYGLGTALVIFLEIRLDGRTAHPHHTNRRLSHWPGQPAIQRLVS